MRYENFQVKRNKIIKPLVCMIKANYNKSTEKLTKSERLMQGIAEWASFIGHVQIYLLMIILNYLKTFSKDIAFCNDAL